MTENFEAALKHILAHWKKQPDKDNLTINPAFLEEMVESCDSPGKLNPEYLTAQRLVWFLGGPRPKDTPMFIMESSRRKLHLGCGRRKFHGFCNVDILPEVNPDLVEDIFALPSFSPNSVELLVSIHAIEHVGRREYMAALKRWHEVLKPGGVLRLAVPDINAAMMLYLKTGNLREIHGFLWGGQKDEYDHHSIGWDEKTLTEDLVEAGFCNIKRYNWRETEHFFIDDYSQSYSPHMDKQNGTLMSLNMEATKP